jgi:glutathione S-transferase
MILYGSQTSPFVRRLRLLLEENSYEFKKVDIFNKQEREALQKVSPILKIPIMEIHGQLLWDSRVIFNELCRRGFHSQLSLHEENLLTALNDISDSLVQRLLAQRSHVVLPKGTPLEISHNERIENILNFLTRSLECGDFVRWDFLSMSLFTLIDWILFRDLVDLQGQQSLLQFHQKNSQQKRVDITDPRRT